MKRRSSEQLSRRQFLAGAAAFAAYATLPGCQPRKLPRPHGLPEQTPSGAIDPTYSDSVDALWDILIPTERADDGSVRSAGAREMAIEAALTDESLLRLAIAQGLAPELPEALVASFDNFAQVARAALNRALDALAFVEKPLTPFHRLDRATQEKVIARGFDDDELSPLLEGARAVAFYGFLGALQSDAGLVAIGFSPFEDFAQGLAVAGYPRTTLGELDDYSYNRAPLPSEIDDLSLVLTPEGDLR